MSPPLQPVAILVLVLVTSGCAHLRGKTDLDEPGAGDVIIIEKETSVVTPVPAPPTPEELVAAIRAGDGDAVADLLDAGLSANAAPPGGAPPLHVAVIEGREEIARILLDHDADVNARAGGGDTALHLAARKGDLGLAKLLLSRDADVDAGNDRGETPLHLAADGGRLEVARLLLERGADPRARDQDSRSPAERAAAKGHYRLAELIQPLNGGAPGPAPPTPEELVAAIRAGDGDAVADLLAAGLSADAAPPGGAPPLHVAVTEGREEIAQILLDRDADVNARVKGGDTALHLAAREGDPGLANLLLDGGADVDARNDALQTPLHVAVTEGHEEIARILRDHVAALPVQAAPKSGPSFVHWPLLWLGLGALLLLVLPEIWKPNRQRWESPILKIWLATSAAMILGALPGASLGGFLGRVERTDLAGITLPAGYVNPGGAALAFFAVLFLLFRSDFVIVLNAIANLVRGDDEHPKPPSATPETTEALIPPPPKLAPGSLRFDVALSYPREHAALVDGVAKSLVTELGHERVFYDKRFEEELARPNLDLYLEKIYGEQSELIVVFFCAEYERKEWCGLEWRTLRDLVKKRRDRNIMPLRLDESDITGFLSIDSFLDIRGRDPESIAASILKRLESNREAAEGERDHG